MRKKNEVVEKLRALVIRIKESNLLPPKYAEKIANKLGLKSKNKVYQTLAGQNSDLDIMEAIIELAEKNKEKELIERAEKLFE